MNAPIQTVLLRELHDGTDGSHSLTITAESSNNELISDPIIEYTGGATGLLKYTPIAGKTGQAVVTVTVSAQGTEDQTISFTVDVEGNNKPAISDINSQVASVGKTTTLEIKGINDGNRSAMQKLQVSAVSLNPAIIPNPVPVNYTQGNDHALLAFKPSAAGNAKIKVLIADNGGGDAALTEKEFDITVYESFNNPPSFDQLFRYEVIVNAVSNEVPITGITDGDDASQTLSFSATSSNHDLLPDPIVHYAPGETTARLQFAPLANQLGTSTITVTLNDNGGTVGNNGNSSYTQSFVFQVLPQPDDTWVEEFDDPNSPYFKSGDYKNGLVLTVANSELVMTSSNRKRSSGFMYRFPRGFDLTQNPYISFEVNCLNSSSKCNF